MRDYESHSEAKALVKVAMFDEGETELMRELGMNPVAYGQALSRPILPHLLYFTSGPDLESHLANWGEVRTLRWLAGNENRSQVGKQYLAQHGSVPCTKILLETLKYC